MKPFGGGVMYQVTAFLALFTGVASGNPNSRLFNLPADDVFQAAQKAAAGHRIVIPQDEGLKNLTDSGEEIKTFQFVTMLAGVTFRVTEEISVEPQPNGNCKVEVFFHKDRGSAPYVPSASLQAREQQLQNQLERAIDALEQEKDDYEMHYEGVHDIDLKTFTAKKDEIAKEEYEAKVKEINQEHDAKIADLAGIPTSAFSSMDAAADKFLNLVEKNLQNGKTKSAAGTGAISD
jgi:hypothetical protein